MALEVCRWTDFADAFTHLSEGRARVEDLHVSVCAVLLAEACNISLADVAHPGAPALTYASNLISREIAYYMFGYFPLRAAESEAFMRDIQAESPYWRLFFAFVQDMRKLEAKPPETEALRL